jgi:hypothetical protein
LAPDPDFQAVARAWPDLSPAGREAVRRTAEALAEAARRGGVA